MNGCIWVQRTFDHPLQLNRPSTEYTLYPSVLPSEELDEFDCTDKFVEYAHPLVSRRGGSFRYTIGTFGHDII